MEQNRNLFTLNVENQQMHTYKICFVVC